MIFSGTLQIRQLARNATWQSGGEIKLNADQTINSTLKDLGISDAELTINAIDATGKLPKDGAKLTFDPEKDTLQTVIDRINKETNVNAFFDVHTGKIAMTAKHSGEGDIDVSGTFGEADHLENSTSTEGVNAIFTFNGLETQRPSNTFQINGFEITLKQETEVGKKITFSSAPDTEKIFDAIVKYIDDYNKLIEELNKQIREPKYRSFQPLSDEQKKELSEKEVELWEEKAKSGTLRNDSDISSMLTKMRSALVGSIKDLGSLKEIGISSNNYSDRGKLIINEEELKKAISENPSKIHELFSKTGDQQEEQGFARRIRTIVDDTQKAIARRAGKVGDVNDTFTMGRTLKEMNNQISRFEDRLKMTEDRYWKQFTAMEKAINRANSQSMYLMNAFGGGM